jgi:hypothetical protein
MRGVVDDDRLAEIAPQHRQVLHIAALNHCTVLAEQSVPGCVIEESTSTWQPYECAIGVKNADEPVGVDALRCRE